MAKMARKKWLAELLVDRHTVGPLLEFLKNMEIKSREKVTKKEAKWK